MSVATGALAIAIIVGAGPSASATSGSEASVPFSAPDQACVDRTQTYLQAVATDDEVHYGACMNGSATVSSQGAGGALEVIASEYDAAQPSESKRLDGSNQTASRSDMTGSCSIRDNKNAGCSWRISYSKFQGTTLLWTRSISVASDVWIQVNSHEVKLRFNHDQGIPFYVDGDVTTMNMQGWLPPSVDSSLSYLVYGALGNASTQRWTDRTNPDAAKFAIGFTTTEITDISEQVDIPIAGEVNTPRFQCNSLSEILNPWCEWPNGEEAPEF